MKDQLRGRLPRPVAPTLPAALRIAEEPLPLHAWPDPGVGDPLAVVEDDVRRLIRRLAVAEAAAAEGELDHARSSRRVLLSLVEIADAFERVFEHSHGRAALSRETKALVGNFRTVYRLLKKVLAEEGVVAIENFEEGFDPRWHEVGETVEDPELADGTILNDIKTGYVWHNRLLRRSQVVVVHNESRPAATRMSADSGE